MARVRAGPLADGQQDGDGAVDLGAVAGVAEVAVIVTLVEVRPGERGGLGRGRQPLRVSVEVLAVLGAAAYERGQVEPEPGGRVGGGLRGPILALHIVVDVI